jgi:hypothetical protein
MMISSCIPLEQLATTPVPVCDARKLETGTSSLRLKTVAGPSIRTLLINAFSNLERSLLQDRQLQSPAISCAGLFLLENRSGAFSHMVSTHDAGRLNEVGCTDHRYDCQKLDTPPGDV